MRGSPMIVAKADVVSWEAIGSFLTSLCEEHLGPVRLISLLERPAPLRIDPRGQVMSK